jgi:hypothetical protein
MGALTLAFDTVITGALALPWVLLFLRVFFPAPEGRTSSWLAWIGKQNQPAAAGVLLFTLTYSIGSVVTRIAQDFFNDDDLHIDVGHHIFRVGVTEDRIRTYAYCKHVDDPQLLRAQANDLSLAQKIQTFQNDARPLCWQTLKWSARLSMGQKDDELNKIARDIFGLQENTLLLKGTDQTLRLRQMHDQYMVLRGAAFNGVIAFSLCLFGWIAALRRTEPNSRILWVLSVFPCLYLGAFTVAVINHIADRSVSDPPYMEFTLLLLAGAGLCAFLWPPKPPEANPDDGGAQNQVAQPGVLSLPKQPRTNLWNMKQWASYALLCFLLTLTVSLGWWSTEVLYAEQVIYSYDSQPASPSPHP